MKLSMKSVLLIGLLATTIAVFAEEEEDVVIESEDEAEIEEEPIDEAKLMEEATGIVDPSNYPGRIISRKKITSKSPAAGVPLTFEYTIWNVGNTDVVDVELNDKFSEEDWSEAVEVSIKVAKIPAGGKHVEERTLTPKEEKKVKLAGAKVSYKSVTSADDDTLVVYQSEGASEGLVPIASTAFYKRHVQSHVFDWICFAMLAVPSTVLPYMAGQSTLTKYGKAKTA